MKQIVHKNGFFTCSEIIILRDKNVMNLYNQNGTLKYCLSFENEKELDKFFEDIKNKEYINLQDFKDENIRFSEYTGYTSL